ncbi:tetratricopeptide repeat protein [Hyphomonas jannaschiana]|uniref:Putative lipoprotein n=1 Tax=Hyphomonas jannaschiana VP2 TaxID=1280952 RepID=A0A059FGA2_9PROT|nr:tetratricopeptide repeat protein [Hyphomonas jannaschiana]KCZ89664.1 putative lipoprotein [Hyphomonas jannaschiana VP2]
MRLKNSVAASVLALSLSLSVSLGACAAAPPSAALVETQAEDAVIAETYASLSDAARATSVLDARGKPVGPDAYDVPSDAVKAGDMAAFIAKTRDLDMEDRDVSPLFDAFIALDQAAAGRLEEARQTLADAGARSGEDGETSFYIYLDAWLLAMEGKADEAINRHRGAAGGMPGLTGDLSLAAMLDALGRPEQALAVYEAMTPSKIEAPEHQFDPKGLIYSHIRTVISRHALLLQRLGRIDEAKAVYQQLADAEPEEAISYAAAMDSLETGKNLKNEPQSVAEAFSQSLADVSRTMQEQRVIRRIMMGGRIEGFDDQRSAFDQVALLISPENEDLRSAIIDEMYASALYDGVAHVATTAPEATASLQIAAAQAKLMSGQEDAARAAIDKALSLTDDDNRLSTLYGALQLHSRMNDEKASKELIEKVIALSENPAEQAAAHGLATSIYNQFGDYKQAVSHAEQARALDDTHDRRVVLADALGRNGQINEALAILRTERLTRPNDPYMLNTLGYFLIERTDKLDEGFKVLSRARAMAERDPYIADSLGWAYFKLGHINEAKRLIELSRQELAPHQHWEIEFHLGDIYWYLDDKEAAEAAWQTALDNGPPAAEKAALTDRLENGLSEPKPERQPLPDVSLTDGEVDRQDI